MAVRIRLKKLGRKHRSFYRVCAMDGRAPRDGRVLEELGTYDPLVPETDARAILNKDRIDYWLGVGAQPTDKVGVLIKKYGTSGTHLDAQKAALDRLAQPTALPDPGVPASLPKKEEPKKPESEKAEEPAKEASASAPSAEKSKEEKPAAEEKTEEKAELKAEEKTEEKSEEKVEEKVEEKTEEKAQEKPAE